MMIGFFKRLVSRLPGRYQQELKRLHFARLIRKGIFTAADENEPEFVRLPDWVRAGDWVIDLGANVGNYTAVLSQLVGSTGRVVAFEPVPETFELLVANMARFPHRNVTLVNAAASDTAAAKGMAVPVLDSGLPNRYMAHLSKNGQFSVFCVPVDSLNLPARVSFVKLDVEGHELAALNGMRALLTRDHPILIVEGRDPAVAEFLAGFGYRFEDAKSPNRVFLPIPSAHAAIRECSEPVAVHGA